MSDDAEADDDISGEIEMIFTPRPEALASQNISAEEFEAALVVALDEREMMADEDDLDDDEICPIDEMQLEIGGLSYALKDLADVEIKGDLS